MLSPEPRRDDEQPAFGLADLLISGERLLEGIVERVLRFVRTCANRHEGARTNARAHR